jgi:hypothetical protein
MYGPYDCPDCHRIHDEPAEALAAFRVQCLDCYVEKASPDALLTEPYRRAA